MWSEVLGEKKGVGRWGGVVLLVGLVFWKRMVMGGMLG